LALLVIAGAVLAMAPASHMMIYPLATRALLTCASCSPADEAATDEPQLYGVLIDGLDAIVLVRPITEEEYGSFMIRAVGWPLIEADMLAAAIVWPDVAPADVPSLSAGVAEALKLAVNRVSGRAVFDVPASPDG
jgi:hypothetical protein